MVNETNPMPPYRLHCDAARCVALVEGPGANRTGAAARAISVPLGRDVVAKMKAMLRVTDGNERSGRLRLHRGGGGRWRWEVLESGDGGGTADTVTLPHGGIVFHTHPNHCDRASQCYLEVPSEQDWRILAGDVAEGASLMHLVVTHSGVYELSPYDATRAALFKGKVTPEGIERRMRTFLRKMDKAAMEAAARGESAAEAVRGPTTRHAHEQGLRLGFVPWSLASKHAIKVLVE